MCLPNNLVGIVQPLINSPMETDINIELRTEVLRIALNLEHNVNMVLLALLSIEKPIRKAITNKSGNLSFKNKIDLMFDLDILSNEEYHTLLLLIEFRNQFLHNFDCNSFEKAVSLLGSDKQIKLLKFDDSKGHIKDEASYKYAFRNLYSESIHICLEKIQGRKKEIDDRTNMVKKLIDMQIFFLDKYFNIMDKIAEVCENNITSSSEVTNMVDIILKIISEDMESSFKSEEYSKLDDDLKAMYSPENIKKYFKR